MKITLLIVNILLALTAIAYPIIWLFFQVEQLLHTLPYVMSLLWLIKSLIHPNKGQRIFALSMAALLFLVGWQRSLDMMYWYPILMNGIMLVLFGGSLFQSQSLVERLARLQTPNLNAQAIQYTRRVTQVWCGVFCLNILLSTLFITFNLLEYWAIYTGVISYIIMGLVMSIEWLIRQRVKRNHYE